MSACFSPYDSPNDRTKNFNIREKTNLIHVKKKTRTEPLQPLSRGKTFGMNESNCTHWNWAINHENNRLEVTAYVSDDDGQWTRCISEGNIIGPKDPKKNESSAPVTAMQQCQYILEHSLFLSLQVTLDITSSCVDGHCINFRFSTQKYLRRSQQQLYSRKPPVNKTINLHHWMFVPFLDLLAFTLYWVWNISCTHELNYVYMQRSHFFRLVCQLTWVNRAFAM